MNRLSMLKEGGNPLITFVYQGLQQVGRNYGNGISMLLQLDSGKRVVDMVYSKAGSQIMGYRYSWNRVGLRTMEERLHRGKFDQFSYDLQMRLKEAKIGIDKLNPSSFDKQLSYVLDLVDNIQKITETKESTTKMIETIINNRNQYTKFGTFNLAYDSNGNLKTKDSKNFSYDYKNQLVKYQDAEKTVEFRYDPFGRRIQKQVKLSGSQTPHITNFYYEGYRVIEERDRSDNLKKQYIYGAGIDEILRMDIFENGTAKPYYFHHNLIGSITGITDNTGNIVELVEYDPYGKPYFLRPTGNPDNPYELSETSTIANNYLFHGREYDQETNLYYFRARYYDPVLSRFLSPDPLGYQDSMNLYQAFNNNPLNFIDPMGLLETINLKIWSYFVRKIDVHNEDFYYNEYLLRKEEMEVYANNLFRKIGINLFFIPEEVPIGTGAYLEERYIEPFRIHIYYRLPATGSSVSGTKEFVVKETFRLTSEEQKKLIGKKALVSLIIININHPKETLVHELLHTFGLRGGIPIISDILWWDWKISITISILEQIPNFAFMDEKAFKKLFHTFNRIREEAKKFSK